MRLKMLVTGMFLIWALGPVQAQQAADTIAPEGRSAGQGEISALLARSRALKDAGQPVEAKDWMIAAANPHAVEAGARVLAAGGTAADAMVAVQAVLGLVEPQSSGLGGGAFLVWHDGASGKITTLDGRETAPLAATPRLFLDEAGQPLAFFDAVVGGRSVGTPGTPALMAEAHARWGRADWPGLFDEAITLAEDGFAVSPRLASLIAGDAMRLSQFEDTRDYFLPGGVPLGVGQILRNPEYAETLRLLATKGAPGFYTGEMALDITERVQRSGKNSGVLAPLDLAIYRVKERAAVCSPYRGYEVCGMGPPSSGAVAVGQILGLLEGFDLAALGPDTPEAWRLIGDASRLAFADRGRYLADSDFVPVPVEGLLAKGYLAERARLLVGDDALPEVSPGQPEFDHALDWGDDRAIELPSTSHISIYDRYGNALSMTTTIENGFGSRLMVGGFLLNNELTDFSFASHENGLPIANRVAPGKRPRSSMAPTILRKDGKPVLIIGSPGGSRIIGYVAKSIIAWVDWGLDVQAAVALPHLVNRFGAYDLEVGTTAEALAAPLGDMGYEVSPRDLTSGLHAIEVGDSLRGGADPRREGLAYGE
ncbi:gamma-glutamyltranspeptidase / glutathione hydrolase [Roseovarius lutimaris]|uniref:Glutathione hydrolase proenzyme n=1 Tax=Roseovarius lutimaris TaxID=1005928 RepID=A0A1I5H4F2_9RHOB|nr:gamma-glutamyltransferase [Roseovarius lutimaris]SFO43087.1 gamma-glutamyltranspeptidase / glutathione hydrolase [Roseovarius lutimaris]